MRRILPERGEGLKAPSNVTTAAMLPADSGLVKQNPRFLICAICAPYPWVGDRERLSGAAWGRGVGQAGRDNSLKCSFRGRVGNGQEWLNAIKAHE
jgi:hypothetical protein